MFATAAGPPPIPTRAPDDPVRITRGGTLRFFGATADGRRSSSWRLWTSRNHKDAYLTPRSLADTFKISLHETGSFQYGFINNEVSTAWQGSEASSRHLDIWPRPTEFAPGWTGFFEVILPEIEMRPGGEDLGKSRYEVLPVGPGYAISVYLAHAKVETPEFPALEFPNANWMAVMELGDNEFVAVMAIPQEWTNVGEAVVERGRQRALSGEVPLLRPPHRTALLLPSTRFIQPGIHVDGSRFVIDAAGMAL
jgi:hypothetical protein